MIKYRGILKTAMLGMIACSGVSEAAEAAGGSPTRQAESRPNIVVIMADDMGFSDVGCYGGEIDTPNIDSLADNGMRFSQFYNCTVCGPTRAALLTGLYNHQTGVKS